MKKILDLFKNSKVKMVIILSFLLFIYTSICAISYAQNVSNDIANSVFRLHVIANSDSEEDQNLKYIVRDSIIEYINEISNNASSKDEVILIAQEHLSEIENIALQTIKDNGYN